MTIICLICKQQRSHEARGLCRTCYQKAWAFGMLHIFPKQGRRPGQDRPTYWREYKRRKAAERKQAWQLKSH